MFVRCKGHRYKDPLIYRYNNIIKKHPAAYQRCTAHALYQKVLSPAQQPIRRASRLYVWTCNVLLAAKQAATYTIW
jgi:hypothetical protein